jgi:hypothetical protein
MIEVVLNNAYNHILLTIKKTFPAKQEEEYPQRRSGTVTAAVNCTLDIII